MNGGVVGEAVTWIALHWQRSRGRRRRRSGRWWRRPTPTDRPTDRGRLPQRMSEGLVGAGNRCAAAAAAEAVASPESRQTDRQAEAASSGKILLPPAFCPSVRLLSPSSGLARLSFFSLLSGPTDRPPPTGDATERRQRYEWFKAAMHYGHIWSPATRTVNLLTMCDKGYMIDH